MDTLGARQVRKRAYFRRFQNTPGLIGYEEKICSETYRVSSAHPISLYTTIAIFCTILFSVCAYALLSLPQVFSVFSEHAKQSAILEGSRIASLRDGVRDVFYSQSEIQQSFDALLAEQSEVSLQRAADPSNFSANIQRRPVTVAVIDTGVEYTHTDLREHMWSSDECYGSDGTRFTSACTFGFDFVDSDTDPYPADDVLNHGTAVASIIGATTNNGVGMSSLSDNHARIMSLRVTKTGKANAEKIAEAIYFAVYNGADIIHLSLSTKRYSRNVEQALALAQRRGIAVVASAGNHGENIESVPQYPASFDGVIAVGSAQSAHTGASWSNYGKSVDVVAPGVGILAAARDNSYRTYSGTSFSAPLVTALLVKKMTEGVSADEYIASLPERSAFALRSEGGKVVQSVDLLPEKKDVSHERSPLGNDDYSLAEISSDDFAIPEIQ